MIQQTRVWKTWPVDRPLYDVPVFPFRTHEIQTPNGSIYLVIRLSVPVSCTLPLELFSQVRLFLLKIAYLFSHYYLVHFFPKYMSPRGKKKSFAEYISVRLTVSKKWILVIMQGHKNIIRKSERKIATDFKLSIRSSYVTFIANCSDVCGSTVERINYLRDEHRPRDQQYPKTQAFSTFPGFGSAGIVN